MSPTTARRSLSAFVIPLMGIAAFGVGLLTSHGRSPELLVHAQDECVPSESGCPLELNLPIRAVLESPTGSQVWLLAIAGVPDFSVSMIGLTGEYSLSVFGPDGALMASSNNPGFQDEYVRVNAAADGPYRIVISNVGLDPGAYTLFANATGPEEAAPAPFDTYAPPPPPSRISPY